MQSIELNRLYFFRGSERVRVTFYTIRRIYYHLRSQYSQDTERTEAHSYNRGLPFLISESKLSVILQFEYILQGLGRRSFRALHFIEYQNFRQLESWSNPLSDRVWFFPLPSRSARGAGVSGPSAVSGQSYIKERLVSAADPPMIAF